MKWYMIIIVNDAIVCRVRGSSGSGKIPTSVLEVFAGEEIAADSNMAVEPQCIRNRHVRRPEHS